MSSVFYSQNLFKTRSKYSETRIYDFICKFLGKLPSTRLDNIQSGENADCVCIECLGKIDEYDLATITAQRVETELRDCLLHAESSISQTSKVEPAPRNANDNHFMRPIETIDMADEFKIENTESNELSDLVESNLIDDYDEHLASDSDEEYHPSNSVKNQLQRKKIKVERIASTRRQKRSNSQSTTAAEQQSHLKCTACNVTFKRWMKVKFPNWMHFEPFAFVI